MKKVLKGTLKFVGYLGFFLVALVFFVYLTLPLEQAKAFVIRYAADEHHLDVELEDISIDGLSSLTITGATITPQPTAEDMERLRKARAARKQWKAAQSTKKGDSTKDTASEDGTDVAKADPKAKGPEAPTSAKDKSRPPKGKSKKKKEEDKPPPIPRGPQPLSIDSLNISVSPFMLISDLMDGTPFNEDAEASLTAEMLGGTITAQVARNTEQLHVNAAMEGLDLSQLTILKSVMPLPIGGSLEVGLDIEVPASDKGKLRFASTTGEMTLSASRLSVGPGKIEKENLDIPRLTISRLGGKIEFEKRRGTLDDFTFTGKDVEGDLSGYIQLYDKLDRWGPRTYVRFKFADAFKKKHTALRLALGHPKVKKGTASDGFTGYTLTGTFSDIKPRARKSNPYRSRSSRASVKKGKKSASDSRKSPSRSPSAAKPTKPTSRFNKKNARDRSRSPSRPPPKSKSSSSSLAAKSKAKVEAEEEEEEEEEEDDEEDDEEEEPKAKGEKGKSDEAKGGEEGDKDEEEE